jgi:hypothetical protein
MGPQAFWGQVESITGMTAAGAFRDFLKGRSGLQEGFESPAVELE